MPPLSYAFSLSILLEICVLISLLKIFSISDLQVGFRKHYSVDLCMHCSAKIDEQVYSIELSNMN